MLTKRDTKVVYKGNGKTIEFPITFAFLDKSHVKVAIFEEATEISVTLTKDYFVDEGKGAVIYPGYKAGEAPPLSEQPSVLKPGYRLVVFRSTSPDQLRDLGEKYPLPIVESMVDKNTMLIQELKEETERALKAPNGSDDTPEVLMLRLFDASNKAVESAVSASKSEANSKASELAAARSEVNSKASELAAANSETNAALSEKNAKASELAAARSEVNSKASELAAADSETNAALSEKNAKASELLSIKAETEAKGHADNAFQRAVDTKEYCDIAVTMAHQTESDAQEVRENTAIVSEATAQSQVSAKEAAAFAASASAYAAPAYDETKSYSFPDVIAYTDGYTYRCTGINITGEAPDISSNWVCLAQSRDDFWIVTPDGRMITSPAPTYSAIWETDGTGAIRTKEVKT